MMVGVDIGTQSLKVVVTDDRLAVLGSASRGYGYASPGPGRAEQDPRLWEQALGSAIANALEDAGVRHDEVRALGICGQLDGCVAVDREGGEPLSPCLIWCDRRAEALLAELDLSPVRHLCGVVPDASHPAAKAAWLRRHGGLNSSDVVFHQPVSYMVRRLTGEDVQDHGLASITMLYALEVGDWDDELLALFGLRRREQPRIVAAEQAAGTLTGTGARLTGLPAGTVVAVGTGDDFSNPLGAGVVGPGTLVCCLGTAEVTGVVIDRPLIDDSGLLQTTAYPGGGYFLENPGWLAGGAVRWAIETFRIDDLDEFDRLAAEGPAGCDGVLFLPGLSGTTAPEWSAGARGCFYGLTPAHGLAHIVRSVLEGCAFAMRDVCTRIGEMQVTLESILLLGGGARSAPWARIRADVSALPVRIPERVDTSPVAAAMLAAVASGTVASLGQASSLVSGVFEHVGPDPAMAETYDRAWRSYRRLYRSLKPMFAE